MNEKLDVGGKAEGESKVDEVGVLCNKTYDTPQLQTMNSRS